MIIISSMIDNEHDLSKFELLYNIYKGTMYSVALDIIRNSSDAEDIVEESLIKIIYILEKISQDSIGTAKCKNLIITITKNTAIDYWRKRERLSSVTEVIDNYDSTKGTEDIYIEMENYQELIECLNELDRKYLDVLNLKILYQLTSKQIGKILCISEVNVNMRFMRAKQILKQKLEARSRHE